MCTNSRLIELYFNIVFIYRANSAQMTILLIKSIDSAGGKPYYLRRSEGKGF